jgi:hypothetical protein
VKKRTKEQGNKTQGSISLHSLLTSLFPLSSRVQKENEKRKKESSAQKETRRAAAWRRV